MPLVPQSSSVSQSPAALLAVPLPTFKAGERTVLPPFAGSADALYLAQLAQASRGKLLTVLTASANDAQRLLDEIPWFAPELRVRLLPDWETLPYDSFSPHHDLISERLATLYSVTRGECDVLLVPASTAVYRFAPPAYLAAYTFFLKKGERHDGDGFRAQLTLAGYSHVTQVIAPGEYSIRGGLIDLFPMGAAQPFRLDLFDDEIESIKTFDVDSQRTLYPVPEIRLLPAREFPLDDKGRSHFRQRFRERFEGDPARSGVYKDVSNGVAPAGIEYWLPLFFEQTATLFDYLPKDAVLCLHNDVPESIRAFWRDAQSRYDMLSGERSRPLLPPAELFLAEEPFFAAAKSYTRLIVAAGSDGPSGALPPVAVARRAEDPLASLKAFIDGFPGRVLLLAESAGRRETLAGLFAEYDLKPSPSADLSGFLAGDSKLALGVSPLLDGFVLDAGQRLAFITESELYAGSPTRRTRHAAQRKATLDNWLRDLTELKIGGPGGARTARYRALSRTGTARPGRRRHGVHRAALRRRRQALRSGRAVAAPVALFELGPGDRAAAHAGDAAVGKSQTPRRHAGARHRRRTSGALRAARGAPGPRFRVQAARLRRFCRRLRLRGNPPTRPRRSTR